MIDEISIDINGVDAPDFEVEFSAKYAGICYDGFAYRDGRMHPEYDYIEAALATQINVEDELAKNIGLYPTLGQAFTATAKSIRDAFEKQLEENNGPYTLGWWHRDHEPSKHIKLRRAGG